MRMSVVTVGSAEQHCFIYLSGAFSRYTIQRIMVEHFCISDVPNDECTVNCKYCMRAETRTSWSQGKVTRHT